MIKNYNIYLRKDGRYEGRLLIKLKRKKKFKYFYGKNYEEVKAMIDIEKNIQKSTLEEYIMYWFEKKRTEIKPSSYARYKNIAELHIYPRIGYMQIRKITKKSLEKYKEEINNDNLGSYQIGRIYYILENVFTMLTEAKIIKKSPFERSKVKMQKAKKIDVLTKTEQLLYETTFKDTSIGAAVMLALYAGLRLGEICALRWENIDFNEGMINIKQTVNRVQTFGEGKKTELIFDTPKTYMSMRSIPMPKKLKNYLQETQEASSSEFVLQMVNGKFLEPRICNKYYREIIKENNLRKITFHSLRHTYATRCLEASIDIPTVSKNMGHESTQTTLNVYVQVLHDHQKKEITKLDKFFE